MPISLRPATPDDAALMVRLVDIAAHGLALAAWRIFAPAGSDPVSYAMARARRDTGGFSWRNTTIALWHATPAAMMIAYPLQNPRPPDAATPALLRPLQALESRRAGVTYLNALATLPDARGRGLATALLATLPRPACLIVGDTNPARRLYHRAGFRFAHAEPASSEGWASPYRHWHLLDLAKPDLAPPPETR